MREQGTLVAPGLWAEEGVGREKLNKHEKRAVLRLRHVRPYIRLTCYPAVSGGASVIRLSLSKLLVNLLQVVERTNSH